MAGEQFSKTNISNLLSLVFGYPEMALQAGSRTGSIFEACDDLLQTGTHTHQRRNTEPGLWSGYRSGVCSPVGVRQLLEDTSGILFFSWS